MPIEYTRALFYEQLSSVFKNIPERTGPILRATTRDVSFINPSDFNSVFTTDDGRYWLRYDHTNELIQHDINPPFGIRSKGPVFRDGPVSKIRKKEFHQFDIDVEESMMHYVIDKACDYLLEKGLKFKIYYNDLSILSHHAKDLTYSQLDLKKQQLSPEVAQTVSAKVKDVYSTKFKVQQVFEIDANLVRGHAYYKTFVFEACSEGITFCAGGTYIIGNKLFFGLSIGLERLALLLRPTLRPVIIVYYEVFPHALVSQLEKQGLSLLFFKKQHNIRRDWQKLHQQAELIGAKIDRVILTTELDVKNNTYRHKTPDKRQILGSPETFSSLFTLSLRQITQ